MSTETNPRRDFLRLTGVGVAISAAALRADQGMVRPAATSSAAYFDVRGFGATGDGKTLDTAAINKTVEAAEAAGGGTVIFPAGNYLSYSIHLKSNVALHLESGATLVAADPPAEGAGGFDLAEPNVEWDMYQDFGHSHFRNSLIWGDGIENVSITGTGRIWGKGLSRGTGQGPNAHTPGVGNKSISLKNCHNVLLRDFSILHGGHFGILATGVDNLTIDNLKIDTNRDGMDIDSCSNVRISNCSVNSPYDDAIVLKSDFSLGRFIPMENCSITNCFVSGGFVEGALLDGTFARSGPEARVGRTGRIKLGTESSGGFKNIAISNCVFDNCGGLALESVDGATLEDVTISNITMRDVTNMPIFIRLGGRDRAPVDEPGAVRHINISDVVCQNTSGDYASEIVGIPGYPVEDVKISNVRIITEGGGDLYDAATRPAELVPNYPEPAMFGVIPSYGFYIRHVDGIELNNIQISCTQPDARPAFMLVDVKNADFNHVKAPLMAGTPMFVLDQVDNFTSKFVPGIQDIMLEHVDKKAF
jgi:polygalacturonase